MKRIKELVGHELKWSQPSAMRREFELLNGEEVVATLKFRSLFGTHAIAQTADGEWTFKRVGFWKTQVTICPEGSDKEVAIFRNNTWTAGGTLELADGRALRANTNFWMSTYEFRNEGEEPLIRFHRFGGPFHLSSKVEIFRGAAGLPELPWLVALGWYLAVKMQDDAGGGAAAAAAG